jgi:hypothetical protein
MSDSVSFDKGSAVVVTPHSVTCMVEAYCLGSGSTVKDFALKESVVVGSVQGTLSFYGLNWGWYKKWRNGNTAICGTIGSGDDPLIAFDIQGRGAEPQIIPVYATFEGGIGLSVLRFNLFPDLDLPTDFRVALAFHRH